MLDAQGDLLAAKERTNQLDRSDKWLLAAFRCASHHADQAWPVNLCCSFQLPWSGKTQARLIRSEKNEPGVVESATSGAPEHLQQLIGLHLALEIADEVTGIRHEYGTHGEINPGGESHRCYDHI